MKFGRTLSEKIREEWKSYAVKYKSMKKVLPKDEDNYTPTISINGTETDQDPEESFSEYWNLYKESLEGVTEFQMQKTKFAADQVNKLQSTVDKYKLSRLPGSVLKSNITAETIKKRASDLLTELQYIQEFLSINHTAFSKILKKYDKRTFSSVREEKLKELLKDKPFLDGSAMEQFIEQTKECIVTLDDLNATEQSQSLLAKSKHASQHDTADIIQQSKAILEKISDSPFFKKTQRKPHPHFIIDEIETGAYLGEGEFSVVKEVNAFKYEASCPICMIYNFENDSTQMIMATGEFSDQNGDADRDSVSKHSLSSMTQLELMRSAAYDEEFDVTHVDGIRFHDIAAYQEDHNDEAQEEVASRGFMKHHCFRDGSARYAIKQLKPTLQGMKRADGAIDLSIEAKFLSHISHSNIIRLRGVGGLHGHPKSFLILDRLYETLDNKIDFWADKIDGYTNCFASVFNSGSKRQLEMLWKERLLSCFDIARALKYLHDHDIIYRDLKPENIGFDVKGNAKLFDFGLAKELKEEDKVAENEYNASGRTGTRRYMAPEVVLCKNYGKPVDVYSFAILLWQVLALTEPFFGFDFEKHAYFVVQKGGRPKLNKKWPTLLKDIIKRSWSQTPSKRPNFGQICNSLKGECQDSSDNLSRTERLMNSSFSNAGLAFTL